MSEDMPDTTPQPSSAASQAAPANGADEKPEHPAIRTMSSDIEELLKTSRPTVSQMVTRKTPPMPSGVGVPSTPMVPSGQVVGAAPAARRNLGPMIVFIFGTLVIAGLIGGGVWYLFPQNNPPETPVPVGPVPGTPPTPTPGGAPVPAPIPPPPPPQPLFSTDASRTITIPDTDRTIFLKLVTDTLQEPERAGTLKRILIKLRTGQTEHYATIAEFFDLWRITPPPNFLRHIDPVYMFLVYYGTDGPRLGFATRTRDPNRTLGDIFFWEQSLVGDFGPFFLQEQAKQPDPPLFEDRSSSNTDWRYIKLSTTKDLGIGYMIFQANRLVIFTTSKTSMENIIKRFYGTQ